MHRSSAKTTKRENTIRTGDCAADVLRPIVLGRASDLPLPVDALLSDPGRVGAELAAAWRNCLRVPRWIMMHGPTREVAGACVLIRPAPFRQPRFHDAVRAILRDHIGFAQLLGVRTSDRMLIALDCRPADLVRALARPLDGTSGRYLLSLIADHGTIDVTDAADALSPDDAAGYFGAELAAFRRGAMEIFREAMAILGLAGAQADLAAAIGVRERSLQEQAFDMFRALLDGELVKAIENAAGRLTPRTYNWIAGSRGQSRVRRLQALAAYPALVGGLCAAPRKRVAFPPGSTLAQARE